MKMTKGLWCAAAAGAWLSTAAIELIAGDASLLMPAVITAIAFWKLGEFK